MNDNAGKPAQIQPLRMIDDDSEQLRSPPQIRRTRNDQRAGRKASNGSGKEETSIPSSITIVPKKDDSSTLPWLETEPQSSEKLHPMPFSTPPSSPTANSDSVADYRRRLDAIKERRARQKCQSERKPARPGQLQCEIRSTTPQQENRESSSVIMDKIHEKKVETSDLFSPCLMSDGLLDSPQTTSTVSMSRTLDEPTTMGVHTSTQKSYEALSPTRRGSARRGSLRRVRSAPNHVRSLRCRACDSLEQDVDTSFAQITDAICYASDHPHVGGDSTNYFSKGRMIRRNSGTSLHPGREKESEINNIANNDSSIDSPSNNVLDRLICTKSRQPLPNPKSRPLSVSFQPLLNDLYTSFHSELLVLPDELNGGYVNDSTESTPPGTSRTCMAPLQSRESIAAPMFRQKEYNEICSSESSSVRPQQRESSQGIGNIGKVYGGRRFLWPFSRLGRDPWYVIPDESGSVPDEENSTDEHKDRMMHAVIFVHEHHTDS